MQPSNKSTIAIRPPQLHPSFTNIGYGNPRYNVMVVYPQDDSVLISCGATLRRVNVQTGQVLYNKQVGYSQIFQILDAGHSVMVVNFEGRVSLLDKASLEVRRDFHAGGKEIRHSAVNDDWIALSCELNEGTKQARLEIYSMKELMAVQETTVHLKPLYQKVDNYYYPEINNNRLIFIEFDDPNPKGRSRTETVLEKKLPVKHKILSKSLTNMHEDPIEIASIGYEGEILCASQNRKVNQIYYLHEAKRLTILFIDTGKTREITLVASSAPHCVEAYENGFVYASKANELTYIEAKSSEQEPVATTITLKTKSLSSSYCIKPASKPRSFIFYGEDGLNYYDPSTETSHSQQKFDITNCGISLNQDASHFAVADFGGNVYIFTTDKANITPEPLSHVCVGLPVRSLAWCHDTNNIVIGTVSGFLFSWDGQSEEATMVTQTNDHTVNIVRYYRNLIIFGTSDGFVHLLSSQTLEELYRFQAHTPIHYENEKDRELFGSMKNYAEIWSIIAYPTDKDNIFNLVTCSEDQTQKVFAIEIKQDGSVNHRHDHHLVGHSLAVTSIDWKQMGHGIGPIYVSCSDDKIVRFRDPNNMFEIIHELETSTIKQWHTLTYLALEPDGHRVAIGSQNGYLFIFDIAGRELLYGEKIHLGGIEGLDWRNGKLITCSSDLCISIIHF